MANYGKKVWNIHTKLMLILMSLATLPLITFAIYSLFQNRTIIDEVKEGSLKNSINSLNASAVESIERTTTDIAKNLANFLYGRDNDIRYLANIAASLNGDVKQIENAYSIFAHSKTKKVVVQTEWIFSEQSNRWIRKNVPDMSSTIGKSSNKSNNDNVNGATFNPKAASDLKYINVPLYDEITFIGLDGREKIKIGTIDVPNSRKIRYANYFKTGDLKDVSNKKNTFIHAETYFPALEKLTEKIGDDIYVSDVIGAYVGSNYIGMYTKKNLDSATQKLGYGIKYAPEEQAFAGEENPVGKRFEGIVRWAKPVYVDGQKIGYVTLALNQDHIMEFVDHITPMKERYTELSSAFEGNYSFIWDYQSRNIAHPRHHSIYGFDPETGEEQIPWLMTTEYNQLLEASGISKEHAIQMTPEQRFAALKANWTNLINKKANKTGEPVYDLINKIPTFKEQKRMDLKNPDPNHTPAADLTRLGYVGLDGRYLNNAPQCTGWLDLTKHGGSGSLYILWSGLYKLNTAAAIPYYTGRYAPSEANNYSRVGFGFVAIGSGIESFTEPAHESEKKMNEFLDGTMAGVIKYTIVSLVVLSVIAIFTSLTMFKWLSTSINFLLQGMAKYRAGRRQFRFNSKQSDEFGELANSFDMLAKNIEQNLYHSVVITDLKKNIVYANHIALTLMHKKKFDETLEGKQYSKFSIYPEKTEYDPFYAYENRTEASIYHEKEEDVYIKGKVMPLLDSNNEQIGYIVESYDVSEIEKRNRIVEDQNSQLTQAQVELTEALQVAQKATKAKSVFLANMSHEIRTPLNAIIGFAEAELMNKLPPSTIGSLEKIYASSKTLLDIINDILDISRIETGKIQLNLYEFELPSIINDSVNMNLIRIGTKPIRLRVNIDENIPQKLFGDALRIKQIFNNLLSNAIKFSESGTITFSISSELIKESSTETICCLNCYVQDTGIGISEEDIQTLFCDYQKANEQAHRNAEGTGLGLAICKKLVEMMEGSILVESKIGKGSKFLFDIKVKVMNEKPIGEEIAHNLMYLKYTKSLRKEEEFIFEEMPYGSVLIVDDVLTNLEVAKKLLEPYKMNIEVATNGYEALDKIRTKKSYDVIFMDYMMPGMDGIETTRIIREFGYDGIIIVLTANAVVGADKMFLTNGFDDFISKPIDIKKLDGILKKYISKSESSQNLFNADALETNEILKTEVTNKNFLKIFKREVEHTIAIFKETIETGDIKLLVITANVMKYACANIGEIEVSELLKELETAGKNNMVDETKTLSSKLVQKLEEILAKLDKGNGQ